MNNIPTLTPSDPSIQFTVPGKPASRGSKMPFVIRNGAKQMLRRGGGIVLSAFDTPIMVIPDANKNSKAYMRLVEMKAKEAWAGGTFEGPVQLEIEFYFERPKSHYRTGKYSHLMKDSAPKYHTQKPDLAKLIRGVEDAITYAGIWGDDSQVMSYGGTGKHWTKKGEGFAIVTITPLTAEDRELFINEKPPF